MTMYKLMMNHDTTQIVNKLDMALYTNDQTILQEYTADVIEARKQTLMKYKTKLHALQQIPLVKQRTAEWFELRRQRLTASDLYDAIKNNNLALAKKKAGIVQNNVNYGTIPALKWGTMFEPMATRCYSQMYYDISVSEFGLIPDVNLEHFGASPDGINELGIMLEIKCPYTREIEDGQILDKYYMQIQGQLAVCGLEECDFIECKFKEYDSVYKYIELFDDIHTGHGIIAEYKNKTTDEYVYLYSEPYLIASHAFNNINKQVYDMDMDANMQFIKLRAWSLEKINIQRINFDANQWQQTVPKIIAFWEKVEECKKLPIESPPAKRKLMFIDDD